MLKPCFLRGAVLLFAASLPVLLHAQFQQPTSDELKMTADPKAPGAAAVYLNINEIANDPMHYESVYARIKVLTEKGKELATVEVPYLKGNRKVADIKGRTIHADGTIIPLTVKPEDLLSEKNGERQFGRVVFTLPSAEVGSILEYQYDLRYDDNEFSSPLWQIQRPYFVHAAHYQFTPFKQFMPTGTPDRSTNMYLTDERGRVVNSLIWWNHLPEGVTIKTSVNGSYSVDVTDIPPIPDEEYMPPTESFLYKVFFYYKAASTAQDFWVSESKLWSKDVDKFAEQSPKIKEAVAGIIAPGDTDIVKATKLYNAVEALDNTDYSRRKSATELKKLNLKVAKHAEDTWAQKSGTSEDIAMLYLAMVRAASLTGYAIKVVDRSQGIFDPSYMDLDQLDTTLVAIEINGKETLLDPGEKLCPFGTLNWRHSDAKGLGQSTQGIAIATTPRQQYTENSTTRTGDLTLDAHGAITGIIRIGMAGQAALRWRQVSLRNDEDELKKQFDHELERIVPDGVEAHINHFLEVDDPSASLMAVVDVTGTLGTSTSKRLLLPGFFFETRGHQPFVEEEKRELPVDMHYGDRVTDEITYHLPDGMSVEGSPADATVSWPAHSVLIIKTKTSPNQVVIADSLAVAFTAAKPEEYQDLRGFYQKVETAFQGGLVLSAAPGTTASAAGKDN